MKRLKLLSNLSTKVLILKFYLSNETEDFESYKSLTLAVAKAKHIMKYNHKFSNEDLRYLVETLKLARYVINKIEKMELVERQVKWN